MAYYVYVAGCWAAIVAGLLMFLYFDLGLFKSIAVTFYGTLIAIFAGMFLKCWHED
jgi:hypothetical protein